MVGASLLPLDHHDTSCVTNTATRRSFAVAAATAAATAARRPALSRTVRAAAAADDDIGSDGQQSSEDANAASPPKRRLAAFDDLFFDATPPPAPARNMPGVTPGNNSNKQTIIVLGRLLDDHQPHIASKHRQPRARNRRSRRRPRHFHGPMRPWPRHSRRGKIEVMPKLQDQKAMGVVMTGRGPKPH